MKCIGLGTKDEGVIVRNILHQALSLYDPVTLTSLPETFVSELRRTGKLLTLILHCSPILYNPGSRMMHHRPASPWSHAVYLFYLKLGTRLNKLLNHYPLGNNQCCCCLFSRVSLCSVVTAHGVCEGKGSPTAERPSINQSIKRVQ